MVWLKLRSLRESRLNSVLLGLVLALLLSGCATPAVPYDRAASKIRTIGVLTPSFPQGASAHLATTVGQSFGLIDMMVDAGLKSRRDATLDQLLSSQGFVVQDQFTPRLMTALQNAGYAVSTVPLARAGASFIPKYPAGGAGDIQAYLDILVLDYGYVAAGIGSSTPYRPRVQLTARLVNAADSSVLMQDAIAYNPVNALGPAITIPPDPEPQFVDFDALTSRPDAAAAGLRVAVDKSANALAALLQ